MILITKPFYFYYYVACINVIAIHQCTAGLTLLAREILAGCTILMLTLNGNGV